MVNDKSLFTIDIAAPPKPKTSIDDATIIFFDSSKFTWFFIKTFNPFTAINPYSNKDTPPNTALGIVDIIAVIFPRKAL